MNSQREILFRGFHPCEDGDTTIYVEGKAVKGRWVEGFVSVHTICGKQTYLATVIEVKPQKTYDVGSYEVLQFTAGQYTGVTDKNSRKIFEGDIAADGVYEYIVTFSEGAWVLKQTYSTGSSYSTLYHVAKQREVIGTIWDKEMEA